MNVEYEHYNKKINCVMTKDHVLKAIGEDGSEIVVSVFGKISKGNNPIGELNLIWDGKEQYKIQLYMLNKTLILVIPLNNNSIENATDTVREFINLL